MSEMVERVAKAIAAEWGLVWGSSGVDHEHLHDVARAAIKSMLEPTGSMLTAMRVNLGGTDELHIDEADEAWRRGIEAALHSSAKTEVKP